MKQLLMFAALFGAGYATGTWMTRQRMGADPTQPSDRTEAQRP